MGHGRPGGMPESSAGQVSVPGVAAPAPGQAIRVTVAGHPVAVFNEEAKLYAVGALCTHVGGPLDQGPVTNHTVQCPWHGSEFDLASGHVVRGPAKTPLACFRVSVEGTGLVFERL